MAEHDRYEEEQRGYEREEMKEDKQEARKPDLSNIEANEDEAEDVKKQAKLLFLSGALSEKQYVKLLENDRVARRQSRLDATVLSKVGAESNGGSPAVALDGAPRRGSSSPETVIERCVRCVWL
jgi:hypothetical protein